MENALYYLDRLQVSHLNFENRINLDLIRSVKPNNIVTMLTAGVKEFNLTKYLVSQLMLSHKDRMNDLRIFYRMLETKIGKLLLLDNVFK